jgi:DivIVA domain-containing protein
MNVSPLDLRQQRFRKVFRGFDRVEVTSFLAAVADDYEHALRETDRMRQDMARMEAVLTEHREAERHLRNTLMTAQKLADDIKLDRGSAPDPGSVACGAPVRPRRSLAGAPCAPSWDVETSIESTIQTLRNTLDYVREQEARDREDKIVLHRPRHTEQTHDDDALDRRRLQGLA